jgi:hypothetical protein
MSISSSKFSKDAKIFEILIGCSLTSTSYSWDQIFPYKILCYPFTYWQSLPKFCHQIMVGTTVSSSERPDIIVYSNAIFNQSRCVQSNCEPSHQCIYQYCNVTITFFDMVKFTTLTLLSLLVPCKLSFLIFVSKISSFSNFLAKFSFGTSVID